MTLVNTRSKGAPTWLAHSSPLGPPVWADTVYPCFIFASGLTTKSHPSLRSLIKRIAVLGLYGIVYNLAPLIVVDRNRLLDPRHWRIPSVLGRIGLASAIGSCNAMFPKFSLPIILLALWFILHFSLSGPTPYQDLKTSVDFKLDERVFGISHLYEPDFDPEGLFGSLLTAPLTILAGVYLQTRIKKQRDKYRSGQVVPTEPSERTPLLPSTAKELPLSKIESHWTALKAAAIWTILAAVVYFCGTIIARGLTVVISQPSSKTFWTPVFVVETAFASTAAYMIAECFLCLEAACSIVPILSHILSYICSRTEVAGMLSLEFFALHGATAAVLKVIPITSHFSLWTLLMHIFSKIFHSEAVAGILTSACLAVALAELMRAFKAFGIRFRV